MEEFNFSNHQSETEEASSKDLEQIKDDFGQLEKKQQILFQKEKLVYILSHLESEGLQAVLRDYGVSTVIDKAKALSQNEPARQFSFLQVLKKIEPSKEKRAILYAKMDGNAHFVGDMINEAGSLDYKVQQEGETIPANYFKNIYSSGDNFLNKSKGMINELKEQDNYFINIYNIATLQTNFSVFPELIEYLNETDSQEQFIEEINSLDPDTSIYDLTQKKFQEVSDEKQKLNLLLKNMREKLQNRSQKDSLVTDIINKIINLENSSFTGYPGSLNQDNYYPVSF